MSFLAAGEVATISFNYDCPCKIKVLLGLSIKPSTVHGPPKREVLFYVYFVLSYRVKNVFKE